MPETETKTPTLAELQEQFNFSVMTLHAQEANLIVEGLRLGLDRDKLLLQWENLTTRMR